MQADGIKSGIHIVANSSSRQVGMKNGSIGSRSKREFKNQDLLIDTTNNGKDANLYASTPFNTNILSGQQSCIRLTAEKGDGKDNSPLGYQKSPVDSQDRLTVDNIAPWSKGAKFSPRSPGAKITTVLHQSKETQDEDDETQIKRDMGTAPGKQLSDDEGDKSVKVLQNIKN